MSYLSIENLSSKSEIFLFKECYALEKIEGTSAHLHFKSKDTFPNDYDVTIFPGGASIDRFSKLFDIENIKSILLSLGIPSEHDVTIFGEAYGGSIQKMSKTYGLDLKFVVFDIKVGENWLSVTQASDIANKLGLDFVPYERISTQMEDLNKERDRPSVQAERNGFKDKKREGVIVRPVIEVKLNNGKRVISKHKGSDHREVERQEIDPERLEILNNAELIADSWVVMPRVKNAFSHFPEEAHKIENMKDFINYIFNDVVKDSDGEFEITKEIKSAICKKAARLSKQYLTDIID